MNSNQQQRPEASATIYLNMDCMEISSSIFVFGDVLFARKAPIENGNETKESELAVDLLKQTIDRTPPSLLPSIRKRGIVVSGESSSDDICSELQQATGIHANLIEEASDLNALAACLTWLNLDPSVGRSILKVTC